MFDITGQDISLLSDEDLRALIGRLCEAELRRHRLSPLAVTWGGHQNAADGGIDVRVAAETAVPVTSAIRRSNVGYQVKAEDMPRGKILMEMRPDDILRASIQELATLRGSYIIISSKGSASYTALRERKRAMKDAVVDLPNSSDLHLDFYDRDRVATWVRDHHGIATWVRERIGRPITGWRPYAPMPEYDEHAFAISEVRTYLVAEEFPRVVRSRLAVGIRAVSYDIELEHISPYQCDNTAVFVEQ